MAGIESTIRRAISGSGGLTVKDSSNSANGTLTLEGMNDYTGATTIADGATLALSGQGRVNQSSGVHVDGTFDVSNASSAQINNLQAMEMSRLAAITCKSITPLERLAV